MSQEKVNAYKENKANRKERIAAEQRKKTRDKIIGWAIAGVLVAGLAVALVITGINMVKAYKGSQPDYSADGLVINNYVTEDTTESLDDAIVVEDGGEVVYVDDETEETTEEADVVEETVDGADADTVALEETTEAQN